MGNACDKQIGTSVPIETIDDDLEVLDDGELVELTRRGNRRAYAVLWDRYAYGARRLARHLGQREEADDVVSDAFAQILDLLQRGKGPDRAFRAYLFTTVRHESGRRAKANQRVMPTDDDQQIDSAVPFGGGQLDGFERTAVRAAYGSLPDRWQTVLWQLDVEGRKPLEIADSLGMKPNSVSALVYRARSGLRDAYLQQHVSVEHVPDAQACAEVRTLLAGVVRRTASARDQERVHAHLETCQDCMEVHLDLQEVNREVGVVGGSLAVAVAAGGGALLGATKLLAGAKGVAVALAIPAAAVIATATVVAAPHHTPTVQVESARRAEVPLKTNDASPGGDAAATPTTSAPRRTPAAQSAPPVEAPRVSRAASRPPLAPAPATKAPAPPATAPEPTPAVRPVSPSVVGSAVSDVTRSTLQVADDLVSGLAGR